MLPFFKGNFDNNLAKQKRVLHKLKVAYVALTRPSELFCIADCSDKLSQKDLIELQNNGFVIDDKLIKDDE